MRKTGTRISRKDAESFRARWQLVNDFEVDELRSTSATRKLRQLNELMQTARTLGWSESLAAEETVVRERWARLRRACDE